VAFHSPRLLSAKETERQDDYLHEKLYTPKVPEIEWMTFRKVWRAPKEFRAAVVGKPHGLNGVRAIIQSKM
jgi:hypothetical protein